MKAIYDKANIILNCGKLKTFWDQEQEGCPLSPLLFNIILEVLAKITFKKEGICCLSQGTQTQAL